MLKATSIALILVSWGALAQVSPPPDPKNLPPPPVVTLTPEEKVTANEAIDKLHVFLRALPAPDMSTDARAGSIQHELDFSPEPAINPTSLPIIGMALSRNSKDPKACALLKKIEPSAVCMK
jgi:hypothetical protein